MTTIADLMVDVGVDAKSALGDIDKVGDSFDAMAKDADAASGKIDRSFDQVSVSARGVDDAGRQAGAGLDRTGEAADALDTRMMGTRDLMTGVQDSGLGLAAVMRGDMFEGAFLLATGLGDLASGVFNAVIPAVKALASGALSSATAMVRSAAVQTVAWIRLGIQSLLAAAKVALAWLIAIGPIALVIAAVVGLVALIIKNWDTVKKITTKVFSAVWGFLRSVWDRITSFVGSAIGTIKSIFFRFHPLGIIIQNWGKIKGWISDQWDSIIKTIKGLPARIGRAASGMFDGIRDAFRAAINAVIGLWNGLRFDLPSVEVFGQRIGGGSIGTPTIPRLHEGGIVPGLRGSETLALLQAGEIVTPAGGGGTTRVVFDFTGIDSEMAKAIRKTVKVEGGGDVQEAFGVN